mmetsp:Transcript_24154/g.70871  ORF Transcript_24154/g.70871 Transcript_24154/m.70871 type:complete len:259 (-) Transcript_24154:1172-1948(-)
MGANLRPDGPKEELPGLAHATEGCPAAVDRTGASGRRLLSDWEAYSLCGWARSGSFGSCSDVGCRPGALSGWAGTSFSLESASRAFNPSIPVADRPGWSRGGDETRRYMASSTPGSASARVHEDGESYATRLTSTLSGFGRLRLEDMTSTHSTSASSPDWSSTSITSTAPISIRGFTRVSIRGFLAAGDARWWASASECPRVWKQGSGQPTSKLASGEAGFEDLSDSTSGSGVVVSPISGWPMTSNRKERQREHRCFN